MTYARIEKLGWQERFTRLSIDLNTCEPASLVTHDRQHDNYLRSTVFTKEVNTEYLLVV